ncbi:hypothetical protein, partial [uncultured Helicobacter sp.]|uniref:hypothetical protein n=1 Tax=uncultured Helicobacter sp. TaxID=175537 RepID=UPI003751DD10
AFSASSAIVAEALLPPCSNDCTPRSGRVSVGATALHILLDFCCAKMAESIGIDSARLVLAHALLFTFGKASLGFFGVVDSVRFLDSEKLDSRFCFCESLDCESKLLKLDSKLSLDSESASDSALGLCVGLLLQAKISRVQVWVGCYRNKRGGTWGVFGGCGSRSA